MLVLKQSTSVDIRMGPAVGPTDGVTPVTTAAIVGADQAEVLKANGAATVAMTGTLAAVTGADGWYDYTCATTDVDTVGEVVFVLQDASLMLPIFVRAQVVEEAIYDALYGASAGGFDANGRVDVGSIGGTTAPETSGVLQVNATQIEGSDATDQINAACDTAMTDYGALQPTVATRTLDVTATGEAGLDLDNTVGTLSAAQIAVNAIGASQLATDAVTEIRDAMMAAVVEDDGPGATNIALDDAIAFILAYAAGQATGQDTNNPVFKSPGGAENRIQGTTDGSGNRSAISLTAPT